MPRRPELKRLKVSQSRRRRCCRAISAGCNSATDGRMDHGSILWSPDPMDFVSFESPTQCERFTSLVFLQLQIAAAQSIRQRRRKKTSPSRMSPCLVIVFVGPHVHHGDQHAGDDKRTDIAHEIHLFPRNPKINPLRCLRESPRRGRGDGGFRWSRGRSPRGPRG